MENGKVVEDGKDRPDGPTGRFVRRPKTFPGKIDIWSFDAPRASIAVAGSENSTISFDGTWLIEVSDAVNAWTAKIRVHFSYSVSDPAAGTGKLEILSQPEEKHQ